jgi:hypothetical protein
LFFGLGEILVRDFIGSRWFALLDLSLAVLAVLFLAVFPNLGFLPLCLGILPWLVRASSGKFPFRRTRFDLLILIFCLTAAVGVWAAYNPQEAWRKFYLLAGGVLLFYALAGQPEENHAWVSGFAVLTGVGAALLFLLANDWLVFPAKIRLITNAGVWLMRVRPNFLAGSVHAFDFADITAGVIAYTTPFLLAYGIKGWRERNPMALLAFVLAGGVTGAGFLLAISRAATIALAAGLAAWAVWAVYDRARSFLWASHRVKRSIAAGSILLVFLGAFIILSGPSVFLNALVNFYADSGRLDVALGTVKLITGFLVTGGGLGSFPGLYSAYVLFVPGYYLGNSHNLFLDVGLEQGVVGMIAFSLIYLISARMLLRSAEGMKKVLLQAAFTSLFIILVQGLVDDIVYGSNSAYLALFAPGIALALAQPGPGRQAQLRLRPALFFRFSLAAATALVLVLLLLSWNTVMASWQANLDAIQIAKVDLAAFPVPRMENAPAEQSPSPAFNLLGSLQVHLPELAPAESGGQNLISSLIPIGGSIWVGQIDQILSVLGQRLTQ